jgi:accessory gene regulator protein AgrB
MIEISVLCCLDKLISFVYACHNFFFIIVNFIIVLHTSSELTWYKLAPPSVNAEKTSWTNNNGKYRKNITERNTSDTLPWKVKNIILYIGVQWYWGS